MTKNFGKVTKVSKDDQNIEKKTHKNKKLSGRREDTRVKQILHPSPTSLCSVCVIATVVTASPLENGGENSAKDDTAVVTRNNLKFKNLKIRCQNH